MKSNWYKAPVFFLVCIASIGTLLRALPFTDLSLNYSNLVHAHSHVAFQGWVYGILLLLVPYLFLTEKAIRKGRYQLQFFITLPLIVCILVSFWIQGYALYSILFSTLFQLMNYWFIFQFFKDTKGDTKGNWPLKFVRIGFWLGFLSTFAPLMVGILSAKDMADTELYESAIYFFLHFQYNGWFLLSLIGLGLRFLIKNGLKIETNTLRRSFYGLVFASVLGYFHSLLGMSFANYLRIPSLLALIAQAIGVYYLFKSFSYSQVKSLLQSNKLALTLLYVSCWALILKVLLQLISMFPGLEQWAFSNRQLIMAYMHLVLIGLISMGLLGLLKSLSWISDHVVVRWGLMLFILGFIISELFLVSSGFGLQLPYSILVTASGTMAFGALLLLFDPVKTGGG